jgi:hypothetical protein
VNGDVGAEACQPLGERPAKPAARARYQRNLALQCPGDIIFRHDVFSSTGFAIRPGFDHKGA